MGQAGSNSVVLDEMALGRPEQTLTAVDQRRDELARASRAVIEATVAFWHYASMIDQPGAALTPP